MSCKESPACGYVATCPDCEGCDDCCECDFACYFCGQEYEACWCDDPEADCGDLDA